MRTGDADTVFEEAIARLGPELSRCAGDVGMRDGTWTLWVDVGISGDVERAWVPNPDQIADSDALSPTPAYAMEAPEREQLESGPPACGSVLMLRFEVSAYASALAA